MQETISLTIDGDVLAAARKKATADHRSLARYVEHLVRRDLAKPGEPVPTILIPEIVADLHAVKIDGEDPARARRREAITDAVFKSDDR